MFLGNFVKRLGQVMDVSAIKMKYYYYYFLETLFLPLFGTGFFVGSCYCFYKEREMLRFASLSWSEHFYIFVLLTGLLSPSVWENIVPEVPKKVESIDIISANGLNPGVAVVPLP